MTIRRVAAGLARAGALTLAVMLGGYGARAADLPTFASAPISAYPDAGRWTIVEENDALFPAGSDKHYTQGAILSYLSPKIAAGDWTNSLYTGVGNVLPIFQDGPGVKRKFDIVFGQSLFTPNNYRTFPLDPGDRPFAGWLYTGGSLLQETDGHMLENLELLAGTIGPAALGSETQRDYHYLIGHLNKQLRLTWKTQLSNEPGLILTYERKWKVWQSTLFGYDTDVIPELGASVGNILTYGEASVMFRMGRNLGVDYGPLRARPSLSGTAWFDADRIETPWGWYVFGGFQGRAIARNIFLDGNSFATSKSVEKIPFVGDVDAGFSVFYKDLVKFDITMMMRSNEFTTQKSDGLPDRLGTVGLSVRF